MLAAYSGAFGGSERALADVAAGPESAVVVACPAGPLADALSGAAVPVLRLRRRELWLRASAATRVRALAGLLGHARELRALDRDLRPEMIVLWGMRSALAGLALSYRRPDGRPPRRLAIAHLDLLPGRFIGALMALAARRAEAVIVPSETVARDLRAAPGGRAVSDRLRVIALGVALDECAEGDDRVPEDRDLPRSPPEILLLGALVDWKRPELALEVAALARRRVPQLRLRLVGAPLDGDDGALVARLRERAAAPDLAGTVELAGPSADPAGELARATALLHCAECEPFGLVVAEALAAGRPAIVPDAGGPAEIVDDTCALVYPPGDAGAAADAVVALVTDPQRSATLGQAGRRRAAQHFGRDRMRAEFGAALGLRGQRGADRSAAGQLALVTVTYDSAPQLRALLHSAERHLPGVRVIVVDCGSRDDSVPVARDHPAAVAIPAGANLGFGRGCNLGLGHVTEPVTVFVNPDVELLDDSLLALAEAVRARGGERRLLAPLVLGAGGARQDTVHPPPGTAAELARIVLPPRWVPGRVGEALAPWRARRPLRVGWAVGCALAGQTETLRRLGPFSEDIFMYGEDLELGLRAAREGIETWFWPAARVLHHRAHATERAYGGEPFALLAGARHRALAAVDGERRAVLDDRAQAVLFASRIAVKTALRRDAARERHQLRAVRAVAR